MVRSSVLVGVIVLCVAGCAKVDKRINKANFDKIASGMTRSDVEALFGGPGTEIEGAEGMGVAGAAVGMTGGLGGGSGRPSLRPTRWGNDYTHIIVLFNREDKVHDGPNFKSSKGIK